MAIAKSSTVRSWLARYAMALGTVAVAFLARLTINNVVGERVPFVLFSAAIAVSTWYGRWQPGLFATVLSAILIKCFVMAPSGLLEWTGAAGLATFGNLGVGVIIICAFEAMHRANDRLLVQLADRKKAEDEIQTLNSELQRRVDDLHTLLEIVPVGVWIGNRDCSSVIGNPAAYRIMGFPPGINLSGTHPKPDLPAGLRMFVDSVEVSPDDAPMQRVARTGKAWHNFEHELLFPDGTIKTVYGSVAPLFDEQGRVRQVIGAYADFTERKKVERALRENESRLSAFLEQLPVGIGLVDNQGRLIVSNTTLRRFIREVVPSHNPRSAARWKCPGTEDHLLDPAQWPSARALRGETVNPGLEMIYTADSGREIWTRVSATPFRSDGGQIIGAITVIEDIDEQKCAEVALRNSEERYRATFDNAAIGIAQVGVDGRWLRINDAVCSITGYSREELSSKTFADITHPDDLNEDVAHGRRLLSGEMSTYSKEKRYVRKDGTFVWAHLTVSLLRDATGAPQNFISIIEDISERKRAEEALTCTQDQLRRHAEELENTVAIRTANLREMIGELQTLSYAITHDMRAPLRAMNSFATLLLEDLSQTSHTPESRDYCERILIASERLDKLIQDALDYSRAVLQEMPSEPVDLGKLLIGLIETYPNLQSDRADISIEGKLPVVSGNEALLTQCFSNLLGNAVKFVAPGTRPHVRVWAEVQNEMARICVRDNGIGIAKSAQSRLFGMFQKLDTQYEGTGIGLAIVRKVAERMGGKVDVESEPQNGSRFSVELPLAPRTGI